MVRSFAATFGTDLAAKLGVLGTTLVAARALEAASVRRLHRHASHVDPRVRLLGCWSRQSLDARSSGRAASQRTAVAKALALRLRLLPVWVGVFAMGTLFVTHGQHPRPLFLLGFGAASLAAGLYGIPVAILRARLEFRVAGGVMAIGRWVAAGLSILAVETRPSVALAVLAVAQAVGEISTLCLAVVAIRHPGRASEQESPEVVTLKAALPFGANGLLATAFNRFDVVLVAALTSITQLARYAPASRIQDALYVIPGSIWVIGLPIIAGWGGKVEAIEEVRTLVRRLIVFGLALALPVAVFVTIFAPEILGFIFGPR